MDLWADWRDHAARLARVDPRLVDAAMAAAMTGFSLRVALQHYPAGQKPFGLVALLLSIVANATVAVRRRAPMTVLVVTCAAAGLSQVLGYWPALNQLGPQLAFSTVAALRPRRPTLVGAVLLSPVLLYCNLKTWPNTWYDTVFLTVLWVAVLWVVGDGVRRLGLRNRQLATLNMRLALQQKDLARQAVVAERVRIAGELHDIVAHHLSVIAVQAELGRYVFDSDPQTARRALAAIGEAGREGLAEMHHLLSVLRPPEEGEAGDLVTPPAPGLDRLAELVERIRGAGVPLLLTTVGDRRRLGEGLEQCAFRIVQESLTNIVKHARPTEAALTMEFRPDGLAVRVVNDGGLPESGAGSGRGLIGMAERARIYDGTLSAGPEPGGRFRVDLWLPTPTPSGPEPVPRVAAPEG